MTSPQYISNSGPEIMGYRIRQRLPNQQDQPAKETMLKVIVKNQTNGIPRIRTDVICNGKLYPFIPLFSFTSEEDLGIVEQISTIVLKDQNEILCELLTNKVNQVRASQFLDLKKRIKHIFCLDLKVDPEELFLLLISDDLSSESEFNSVFDSISETEFVNVIKKIYENCPNRVIPKILRKINKYFNSTKGRDSTGIERLRRILKLVKSVEQSNEVQQKQEAEVSLKKQPKNEFKPSTKQQQIVQKKGSTKVINVNGSKKQKSQPTIEINNKKTEQQQQPQRQRISPKKPTPQVPQQKQQQEQTSALQQQIEEESKPKQKKGKKQKVIKVDKLLAAKKQQEKAEEEGKQEDWHDVESGDNDDQDISDSIDKMAFHADDSDEDHKYVGPKKKNKKQKNNQIVQIDPQVDYEGVGKKPPHLKKQKKQKNTQLTTSNNNSNKHNKAQDSNAERQEVEVTDKRQNIRQNKFKNNGGVGNNEQSLDKGKRQWSKENKKIDARILLGLNGASDSVWREKMRPPKFPQRDENNPNTQSRRSITKQNQVKASPLTQKQQKATQASPSTQPISSKPLTLQKVFSIPADPSCQPNFKFQKRNYNIFVNKLFWVNISDGQVTIQKDGKGYIRKCQVDIIDGGKGLMADGLTLSLDGTSNLQDGGIAFGEPNFEEFTPDGQWFHITNLEVYAYV